MKKVSVFLVIFLIGSFSKGFCQTPAPPDFFAGKWEISLTETPVGDVKFVTNLIRKDGKLTGELANATEPSQAKRPITKVEENATTLIIYFKSSQDEEIPIEMVKVDNDHLQGQLMGSFDAKAKRIKE